ncbi:MAG: glycosyltransferase family 1 protein [Alphaproteobacteria bacterium]|nr:glycosyltransferase family 1 protein [Alphaproteobacteria bacterium]
MAATEGWRVAIVSDAWHPQVNGVVRTLSAISDGLAAAGHHPTVVGPEGYRTLPCPGYADIRLAVGSGRRLARQLEALSPRAVHIATEGPLGWAARAFCLRRGWPFTTAYHTRFPEYLHARWGLPTTWTYTALRRFHAPSHAVMVATETVRQELAQRGFARLVAWTRGVDASLFHPHHVPALDLPRPVFLYVGRIALEKNLPAFLDLALPGSKLVVGDGPLLAAMRQRYPLVHFAGAQSGEALARHYAAADVLVMPSRTETFGLVMLEALACGVPVAAFPGTGPSDVIGDSGAGVLDPDLGCAARRALNIPRERCLAHARRFSWDISVAQFLGHLALR